MDQTPASSFKALAEKIKRDHPEEYEKAKEWAKKAIASGEWRDMFSLMEKQRNDRP